MSTIGRTRWVLVLLVLALGACPRRYGGRGGGGDLYGPQLERDLAPAEQAFIDGRFDEGMAIFTRVKATAPHHPVVLEFMAAQEKRVVAEATARANQGRWGSAWVLSMRAGTQLESATALARADEYKAKWLPALRDGIAAADRDKRPALAALQRGALAAVTRSSKDLEDARRSLAAVTEAYRLGIEVTGKGDAARLGQPMTQDARFTSSPGAGAERVEITATVGAMTNSRDVKRQMKTAQIEQGTRAVENPAHAQLEAQVADYQDHIQNLHEQIEAEQQSPTRSQGSIDTMTYEISVIQGDLDEANANLAATPATVNEPNYVDFTYEVETHTLVVARDVTLEARFAAGGAPVRLRENVKVSRSDDANAAQPQIGLAKNPADLPPPRALSGELDQAVARWATTSLDAIHRAYRDRLVEAATGDARGEALALYVALGPTAVDPARIVELEKVSGVPASDGVFGAVLDGTIQLAFSGPRQAHPGARAAPARPPATKPGPTVASQPPRSKHTPSPAPEPVRPADPIGDQVRAKAGRTLTFFAFEIKNGAKTVVQVDRDGKLSTRGRVTAVWRRNGVLEDAKGKVVLAVAKNGDVWIAERQAPAKKATLGSGRIVIDGGVTLTILPSGQPQLSRGKDIEVSTTIVTPASVSKQDLALLVTFLSVGEMTFKKPGR
jgi:hypothetical protein